MTDDCQDQGLTLRCHRAAIWRRRSWAILVRVIVDRAEEARLSACASAVPHAERDALALAQDILRSHAPMAHVDSAFDKLASAREPVWACREALG